MIMKKLALIFFLSPLISRAQMLEVTLKAGRAFTTALYDNPVIEVSAARSYGGSLAATVGTPEGLRIGLAVSAYKVAFGTRHRNSTDSEMGIKMGAPVVPVELLAIRRIYFSRFSLDLGLAGGVSLTRTITATSFAWGGETKVKSQLPWFTYGFIAGFQSTISKRMSLGLEMQPKWLDPQTGKYNSGPDKVFILPVQLKLSMKV